MTDRVGLKPNEDEYILMGMALTVTQIDSIKICERLCYGIKKTFTVGVEVVETRTHRRRLF